MEEKIQTLANWLKTGSINVFGKPFSGKDTQGKILASNLRCSVLSSGQILRDSQLSPEVQKILDSGGIIPSDTFEDLVLPYLSKPEYDNQPIILSEVGRLMDEAKAVMQATAKAGHQLMAVIYLDISDAEVWNRLSAALVSGDRGKRADDNQSVLQTRLDRYNNNVIPVIEFYRQQNLLVEVNGSLPVEEVTNQIINGLIKRIN